MLQYSKNIQEILNIEHYPKRLFTKKNFNLKRKKINKLYYNSHTLEHLARITTGYTQILKHKKFTHMIYYTLYLHNIYLMIL